MKYLRVTVLTIIIIFLIPTELYAVIIRPIYNLGEKFTYDSVIGQLCQIQATNDYNHKCTFVSIDGNTFYAGIDINPNSFYLCLSTTLDNFSGYEIIGKKTKKRGELIECDPCCQLLNNKDVFFSLDLHLDNKSAIETNNHKLSIALSFLFDKQFEQMLDKEITDDDEIYSNKKWQVVKEDGHVVVHFSISKETITTQKGWYAFNTPVTFDAAASRIIVQKKDTKENLLSIPFSHLQPTEYFDPTSTKKNTNSLDNALFVTIRDPQKGYSLHCFSLDDMSANQIKSLSSIQDQNPITSDSPTLSKIKKPDYSGLAQSIIKQCLCLTKEAVVEQDNDRLTRLNGIMKDIGMSVKEIPSDHYCFYHAVATWLNESQLDLRNCDSIFKEDGLLDDLQTLITSKRLDGKTLFEQFKVFTGIITSLQPVDDKLDWATGFEAPVGIGMWADERIITNLLIPLTNKSVAVIDTVQVSPPSYFRGEWYRSAKKDPDFFTSEEDLVKALTDPDTIVLAHRLLHWEVILPTQ
ncbi:hypothetical protein N9V90_01250 [Endozoicomonas sp.]|nr:hypothetical protein [Endozoicomonas sp.]